MNFLEKIIVLGLTPKGSRTKYVEQGEVEVEINHINSVSRGNRYGQMTTEFEYQKYPLVVTRPAEGKTVVEHNCQICGAPLKIVVRSKRSWMKIINPAAIAMLAGIVLIATGAAFYEKSGRGTLEGIPLIAGVALLFIGAGVLIFTLPWEYKDKGIDTIIDTRTDSMGYARHGIKQSPTG